MRIGLLGGTFDPIHLGHLSIAEEARSQLELDRVYFIPAGQPWMRKTEPYSVSSDRAEMVKLAIASNPYFEVHFKEIDRPGLTYTVDTLEALATQLGPQEAMYFILGQDAVQQFYRWKEPEKILGMCHLAVMERPGYEAFGWAALLAQFPALQERAKILSMPSIGVSSTEIRRRAAAGISIRYLVPPAVAEYIQEQGLYRNRGDTPEGDALATFAERENIIGRLLALALARGALKYGDFTLTSGKNSKYYFDGRLLSLDPEGSRLIAEALLPILRSADVDSVGGLTLGADPIVSAITLVSGQRGEGIPGFIVRKEAKAHGTGQYIEGPLRSGSRVAILDDTCTTGGSLLQAIEAAEAAGCSVVKVATILDRKEGGSEEVRRRGYDFVALLQANSKGVIEVMGNA